MSALTTYRAVERLGDRQSADSYQPLTIAAGITIYGGSLLFLNASGEVVVASPDQTMTCVGYHAGADIDNTADGETVIPQRGVIDLANNATSIAVDDIGKLAYAVDNQTVDLDSNGGTRCAVGSIEGIRADGRVYVKVGMEGIRALQLLELVQPIDADLTAIAALAGTSGVLCKTAANTWALRTLQAPAAGFTITNPAGVAGDPTFALANGLAALEALASTGLVAHTAADTYAERTIVVGSAALVVTNGNGVSGNPSLDASAGLKAIDVLAGTGFITQTGGGANNGTYAQRSIQAASAGIAVTNGDGGAGNPQIDNLFAAIELADPGTGQAIPVTRSQYVGLNIAGAGETNTIAIPSFVGQKMILNADAVGGGGDRAVTASQAINQAGNTIMTFAAVRDCIVLEAIKVGGALRWQVTANDGAALS